VALMSRRTAPRADDAPRAVPALPAVLDNLIGYHLRLAQEASFQAIRQGLGKSDLKPGWYTILTILSAHPGITPTDLSRLCGRDRSTLTATLKGLTARGFIASRRKSGDQRSYGVRLTPAGEAMLQRLQAIATAHDARLDAIIGKDKPLLIRLLRRIAGEIAPGQGRAASARRVAPRAVHRVKAA
jgi:DNA-binding MarR family transcriptional regulator